MSMKRSVVWLLVLCLPIMFFGCNGGSSGGSTAVTSTSTTTTSTGSGATALTVASKVSVVDAKLSGSVAAVAPLHIAWFKVTAADLAATTDYKADKTQVYVSERSAEVFGELNNILCMVSQSKYDAMLNKGDYVALVDNNQCSDKSNASSAAADSQNQSSSTDAPNYSTFVVNSSRADDNSPEIAKVWVHLAKEPGKSDPEMIVYVKITITEGKSDTNPYGLFHMELLGYPAIDGVPNTSQVMFKGMMKTEKDATGQVLLKFAEQNFGPYSAVRKITMNRAADGNGGTGSAYSYEPQNTMQPTTNFDIAFNADYFLRKDGTNTICLDRNAFEESAWMYGLYDTAGKRVNRNSGFSINTKADGSGKYGFIGYWGMSIDNSVTLKNGDTLYKFDYSTGNSTPFTVFASGGKLKKHTRKTLTLGEIQNLPLGYNEFSQGTSTNYQVTFDGTNFNKIAYMPQCTGNCSWKNIPPDGNGKYPIIDLTQLSSWGNLNFYSQNGGGQYQVQLASCGTPSCGMNGCVTSCSLPALTVKAVIFYAEDLVYPGDTTVPPNLACYDNCPTVDSSGQATMSNMMSNPSMTPTAMLYSFETNSLMLKDSANKDVISTVTNSMQSWGIMTGALFDNTDPSILNQLVCPWNNLQTCTWMAQSVLPVYYTWETGPNSWNQFISLRGAQGILTFEPPLKVKYVHHKAGSPVDGTTFMMDYSGFGNLMGIPGKCVSMDTGKDVDCGPGAAIKWVPAFVIPPVQADGSLTKVSDDTTDYLVKPLQLEQRMKENTAGCTGLTVTSYTLPDLATDWTDPAIGTEPVVTSAPAVVGGVVQ